MILATMLALTLAEDRPFEADVPQYSAWVQEGCRLQQSDREPGTTPDMYGAFCECLADELHDNTLPETFRVMALSLQGHAQGRGSITAWETARDTAFAEYETLPEAEKTGMSAALQSDLIACVTLGPPVPGD